MICSPLLLLMHLNLKRVHAGEDKEWKDACLFVCCVVNTELQKLCIILSECVYVHKNGKKNKDCITRHTTP